MVVLQGAKQFPNDPGKLSTLRLHHTKNHDLSAYSDAQAGHMHPVTLYGLG